MNYLDGIEGELNGILGMVLPHFLDRETCNVVTSELMRELVPYVNNRCVESYWFGVDDAKFAKKQ